MDPSAGLHRCRYLRCLTAAGDRVELHWRSGAWHEPPPPPVPVPTEVASWQAKAALHGVTSGAGTLLDAANAAVAASGNVTMQLAWAQAATFHRDSNFVNQMATALSLSSNQVDDLFVAAEKITA